MDKSFTYSPECNTGVRGASGTLSDSVYRLEATNTGFCWLLTSVTCHVSHVTQTVISPMQASTVGGVSLRLRWNNRLKFVPINV